MNVKISSVVLYGETMPNFDKLKAKGWRHPLGLRDEILESGLYNEYGDLRFTIYKHTHISKSAAYPEYHEIFVSHKHEDVDTKPILKGESSPYSTKDLVVALLWLEHELD